MSKAEIIVKAYFFESGKEAPKHSGFTGVINKNSLFGGGNSWVNYTGRKDSIKNSMDEQEGSFSDYTGRKSATEDSAKKYFTMTDSKKLYTQEERSEWQKQAAEKFGDEGKVAWTLVVSLRDRSLLQKYGITDQNEMAEITNTALNKVFRKLKFRPENMVWWEDYHTNTKNPHMHVTFFEKEPMRSRGKLKPTELDMVKSVFISEMAARKQLIEQYGISSKEYLKQIDQQKHEIINAVKGFPYATMEKIVSLYSQLPESGRLQYNSENMKPYHEEIDDIVNDILQSDGIKDAYEKYGKQLQKFAENLNQLNGGEISHICETEDHKLRVQVANCILNEFKQNSDQYTEQIRNWKTERFLSETKIAEPDTNDCRVAIDMILGSDAKESLYNGISKLKQAEKTGSKTAKRLMNILKQSFGLDKKTYGKLQRASTKAVKDVRKAIQDKTLEIQMGISAFLQDEEDIAVQKRKDNAVRQYLENHM